MKVAESTFSGHGLTHVPKAVQSALQLKKGDMLEWYITNQEVIIKKKVK